MGGLFDSDLIPVLFVIFMMINVFLDKKRHRQQKEDTQQMPPAQEPAKDNDVAADFERRLKKTTEKSEMQQANRRQRIHRDGETTRIRRDADTSVHHDGEAAHDSTGRIHREQETLVHDKGRVYYDPRSDYSYSEEQMNAAAAAFNAHYAKQQPTVKKRVKLKHAALADSVVMAEILGKPRALQPYDGQ